MTKAPNAKWAQRKDKIFLTINIPNLDPAKTKINVTPTNFSFTSDEWSLVFDTFGEVNPDECKWTIGARDVTVLLVRKEEGEYWDKLQKGAKIQNMTVDWDKWKDEDEVADDVSAGRPCPQHACGEEVLGMGWMRAETSLMVATVALACFEQERESESACMLCPNILTATPGSTRLTAWHVHSPSSPSVESKGGRGSLLAATSVSDSPSPPPPLLPSSPSLPLPPPLCSFSLCL
eukprot:CAMPEP_0114134458 /NCGR_PEP_ID=MMETSP0043_2-20121206/14177_1 /TAXON_ID=464988 /ORGANISM="Hemiselmis andersenii, Strain CCMP644" /LENGTH=233 /DNA_ID=CAMNT_0001228117 /DNA_START=3 /DNA_END=700 /DNA_ORIENTATION=+